MLAQGQAAVLKCEATLNALQTAFAQARRELAEVRSALDTAARRLEMDSQVTFTSSQVGNLDQPRSPWDLVEETSTTAVKEITNGKSLWSWPALRVRRF